MQMSLEDYLLKMGRFADDEYGKRIRDSFADNTGISELAMLQSPSRQEMDQLRRAVAIMTPREKASIKDLADEQIQKIAEDAAVDPAVFAIFINGYILECKRVS